MLSQFVSAAQEGKPVFLPDVRNSLGNRPSGRIDALLVLPDGIAQKQFSIPLPRVSSLTNSERDFLARYIRAEIYNHLTTLGGYALTIYRDLTDPAVVALVNQVIEDFQIDRPRAERTGYGRIVNVLDRMNDTLHPERDSLTRRFTIEVRPINELPTDVVSVQFRAEPEDIYHRVTEGLEGTMMCGLDVGGTDIKAALVVDGRLIALKEYDWNPAAYQNVEEIIDPVALIARLLRARAAVAGVGAANQEPDSVAPQAERAVVAQLDAAFRPHADLGTIKAAVQAVEDGLGGKLEYFDAIGLCFPDVVVQNRIVGGEVPKTRGMRSNTIRDFEEQFAKLSTLNLRLKELCRPGGVVMNTNDGPMAAFTAAVELAASPTPELGENGVFAHTLGTDLGTGLALANGSIPEIPLEAYNLVLDIGSDRAARLPAEDLRSLANTNTGIPGTPQKLASQAGAFRLADELIWEHITKLRDDIIAKGYVVESQVPAESASTGAAPAYTMPDTPPDTTPGASTGKASAALRGVPESPVDQRKAYLSYLMGLAETNKAVAQVFRTIGEYMSVVYEETEHLLETGLTDRFLFGRFVKVPRCFELIQEGAGHRSPTLRLVAADSGMAYTPLMRALDADPDYTVAQFGQAIGAVYFANLGRIRPKLAD